MVRSIFEFMKTSFLDSEIWLPKPLEEIFHFFSDAHNLEIITPPFLRFEVLTEDPIDMREGALIEYRIMLHGIPLRWRSRIEVWEPPHRFVDDQINGPYRRWRHEHCFESRDNGTVCLDRVRYAVLGGPLADLLFVRRDVGKIFEFRRKRLQELFQ